MTMNRRATFNCGQDTVAKQKPHHDQNYHYLN